MHRSRMYRTIGAVVVSCALAPSVALGQQITIPYDPSAPEKRGQAGMTFLQVDGSTRAAGMGGAFAAVTEEPSAVFYNPSAMATLKGLALYANQTSWFADMKLYHLAASGSWRQYTGGLTFVSMDYGYIERTIIVDRAVRPEGYAKLGNIGATAWAAGVFLATQLTDRFSAGFHVKYAVQDMQPDSIHSYALTLDPKGTYRRRQDPTDPNSPLVLIGFEDNRVATFAYDIGTQYRTGIRNITLNMSLTDFAGAQNYVDDRFDLPLTYRVGLATEVIELVTGADQSMHRVLVIADGVDRRDVPVDVCVGVEYTADLGSIIPGTKVALRAGRRGSRHQDGWLDYGGSAQFGYSGYNLRVDYAHSDYGAGLAASRIGLAITMK